MSVKVISVDHYVIADRAIILVVPSDSINVESTIIITHVGHHRDNLTMNKLLHLPLSTFLEFVNIPREIGNHLSRLRAALSSELFVSIWSTDNVCAPHQDQECDIDDHNMYELDAEQINQHFLQEWISGRFPSYLKASWISLACALDECEIGNCELA